MPSPSATSDKASQLPVTVIELEDDDCTYVSLEYAGARHRFAITGGELPFQVTYLHDFGLRGRERTAWFDIAPQHAAEPRFFEQHLYPQLVRLRLAELQRRQPDPSGV